MVNRISQTVKTLRLKAEDFLVSFTAVRYTLQCHRAMHDDPKNDCEGDYKRFLIEFDCRLCFVLKDSSVFEYVHVQKSYVNK